MSEEEARKLIRKEFMNNVMSNLDSSLIFTYIQNLEKELTKLKKENEELRKQNIEYQDEIFARDNSYYDMQD